MIEPAALERARRWARRPLALRAFFLWKLPLAFAAGLRIRALDGERCEVRVPYGWRTTNPFRSIYFAALAMAAELSTGTLMLVAVRAAPASVSMLVTGMEGRFGKKADDDVVFTCHGAAAAIEAVARTVETGEPVELELETVGRMRDGTEVARFGFRWSVKRR